MLKIAAGVYAIVTNELFYSLLDMAFPGVRIYVEIISLLLGSIRDVVAKGF